MNYHQNLPQSLDHQSFCTSISTLSNKINGLCANNDQLQNQLTFTVSSLSTVNNQTQGISHGSHSPDKIVDDYLNHERRKLNLVIYGLPEPSVTSAPERQLADLNSFKELVDSEFKIDNPKTTKCFHLGKPRNGIKPRLLLFFLTENVIHRQILRNARLLRNSNIHKNLLISRERGKQTTETRT